MTDVKALVGWVGIVPHDISGPSVERPDVIRRRFVQNAVEEDRRGFYFRRLTGLKGPCQRDSVDIRRSNLRQAAVVLTRVESVSPITNSS